MSAPPWAPSPELVHFQVAFASDVSWCSRSRNSLLCKPRMVVDSVEVQVKGGMSKVQEQPEPAAAEDKGSKESQKEKLPSASCAQLFQFATLFDMLLMFVGAIAAAFTGAALPLFIVFFAELLEEVGSFATGESLSFDKMWSSCRAMFLMGGGAHIGGFVYGWAFDLTKERQLVKLKKSYLKAIVRQDIGWFDVSNPQELPSLIGSTQADISASLGSATWQLFEHIGMAIAGFAVSLSYGWDVALVMVLCSPLIVASGALLGYVEKVSTAKISAAYATSGGIASEALSALRTVASLGLEPTISTRYESFLGRAEAASIKRSYLKGAADALLFASGNAMMGLGALPTHARPFSRRGGSGPQAQAAQAAARRVEAGRWLGSARVGLVVLGRAGSRWVDVARAR